VHGAHEIMTGEQCRSPLPFCCAPLTMLLMGIHSVKAFE
jgi:hypothetical protein